jgi:hypothetical protein
MTRGRESRKAGLARRSHPDEKAESKLAAREKSGKEHAGGFVSAGAWAQGERAGARRLLTVNGNPSPLVRDGTPGVDASDAMDEDEGDMVAFILWPVT